MSLLPKVHQVNTDGERKAGRCAFANREIATGEIVAEYGGEVIDQKTAREREALYHQQGLPPAMFFVETSGPERMV